MVLLTKHGNILNCSESVILHQCNCVSTKPVGLANSIFNKYPYANIYKNRIEEYYTPKELGLYTPGTIIVSYGHKIIINLFGQLNPGKPNIIETSNKRQAYFLKGLKDIDAWLIDHPEIKSIAVPYKIGCGMAGGNWETYSSYLQCFADDHPNIDIVIYQLTP